MPIRKTILFKMLQSIFEYLLLLPILLVIGIHIVSDTQLWFWLICLFGLFTIGIMCRTMIAQQKWWFYSCVAMIIGMSSTFIFVDHLLFMIILTIIHMLLVYRGMMYASQAWEELLPHSLLWIGGLGVYFVSYFIFRYVDVLNPYLNLVTVSGVVFVILTLFTSNSDHLKSTTLSKEKKPFISQTVKRQNRIFIIITIAIILLIANGRRIQETLWNGFRGIIQWMIELLSDGEQGGNLGEDPPPAPVESVLPVVETKEPSAFAKLLEVIAMYVVYISVAIVIILLILLLMKKTRRWLIKVFQKLLQFLRRIGGQITARDELTQYIEEKESVFDWRDWKEENQSKVKAFIQHMFKRKPKWESLSNQEKVRFVFRELIEQEMDHSVYKAHETPREILESLKTTVEIDEKKLKKLKIAYEQARYGDRDVEQQIVDEIYGLIGKSKQMTDR